MRRELMNRKPYPYYGGVQNKSVVSKLMVIGGLTVIGVLALVSKVLGMTFGILGLGVGLIMYPILHPISSLVLGSVTYGVWRWLKRR